MDRTEDWDIQKTKLTAAEMTFLRTIEHLFLQNKRNEDILATSQI
jgi:hypothetical protein